MLDLALMIAIAVAAYALGAFTMALWQYWQQELAKPAPPVPVSLPMEKPAPVVPVVLNSPFAPKRALTRAAPAISRKPAPTKIPAHFSWPLPKRAKDAEKVAPVHPPEKSPTEKVVEEIKKSILPENEWPK